MKTTFIDTVFVVALVNCRDQCHARAVELAEQYEGQRFVVTDAVLIEIGNALARHYKREAAEAIERFLSSDDVEVVRLTAASFAEAFALYKIHRDKGWGMTDALSFAAMRRLGITEALTFDEHFVQAGFKALMRDDE